MNLVITWSYSDGYTYSCDITQCVVYSSAEQFIVDLEKWSTENKGKFFVGAGSGFIGTDIYPEDFLDNWEWGGFRVRTLEEWFKDEAVNQ